MGTYTGLVATSNDIENAKGRSHGFLRLPDSRNASGWASVRVPYAVIARGSGPTVLVTGGNHGDEHVGPFILWRLIEALKESDISGRLVIIPCLSVPAAEVGARLWPSGHNFNRLFSGVHTPGPATELARYVAEALFPMVDAFIDIHSGGQSMAFLPMSHMHLVQDPDQRQAMLSAMLAWNTDYHMAYIDTAGSGLMVSEAERQGKVVVSTELGGASYVSPSLIRNGLDGLTNVLKHLGVVSGATVTREGMGLSAAAILDCTNFASYVEATTSGIYEVSVDLGTEVEAGEHLGFVHALESLEQKPVPIASPINGVVCGVRGPAPTRQGDCVAVVGVPTSLESLKRT